MVQVLESIDAIADQFDAIVLDQWGVLHDGSAPYPAALLTLGRLQRRRVAVLSNSGKRAAPNAARIAAMGFDTGQFHTVMTSGEALWQLFADAAPHKTLYPIEGKAGDAAVWANGLGVVFTDDVQKADAILVMGLPDGSGDSDYAPVLAEARDRALPLYCSNPDMTSPRGGGAYVMSPGVLAAIYAKSGGEVHLFGKPNLPVFKAMQAALGCAADRILMVGDSLHHDIKGAQDAGWASLLIHGGIHAPDIGSDPQADILRLAAGAHISPPDFSLPDLR